MDKETLTYLANQAVSSPLMVAHYPDPDDPQVTFPPSPYYRFLRLLADYMQARLSVELGVCGGGGSLHLAMGSEVVVGVDVALDYQENIRWVKRHYPNFHFRHMDSVKSAKEIYLTFGEVDILFIDTTHTYDQTMREYDAYEKYLSAEAVVCLDDLFRSGMIDAFGDIPGNKLRMDFLHPSQSPTDGGFGVIWR